MRAGEYLKREGAEAQPTNQRSSLAQGDVRRLGLGSAGRILAVCVKEEPRGVSPKGHRRVWPGALPRPLCCRANVPP
jgi:hypothetical protein